MTARFCTACGKALETGARFCGACGAATTQAEIVPEKPAGERRHAIILFADIAGYTDLTQKLDAEDVHALLMRFFEAVDHVIADHGGNVDKHIGDAVMAVFGAPIAHDNDAYRAAAAALQIQLALATSATAGGETIRVRIGLAAGEVVADSTGSSHHREYTVTGEAVNLAARLQSLAAPGEILIDEAIESTLAGRVATEPIGPKSLKGFATDRPVWRLIALAGDRSSDRARPFVGRTAQLAQITGALEGCRAGGAGQTLVIRGEAGMGKTRLIEELHAKAKESGYHAIVAHALDFGAASGADPIRQIAQALLSTAADASVEVREKAVAQSLADGLSATDHLSFLNDLFNLPQPPALQAVYDALTPRVRAEERSRTVARLCRRFARRRQPLLIIVEDVHWADAGTLAALARLARSMSECPGILVMTTRVEGDPFNRAWRAAARDAAILIVDLPPLRLSEAMALAGTVAAAPDGVIASCVDRAEGNPLFLVQLLKSAGTAAGDLPGTVQSLVQARMDRLGPQARAVLQTAAAIGQRFPFELLGVLHGDAGRQCEALVDELFLRREGEGYMFAHALIRDGINASLLRARRQEIHARVAAWYAERDPALHAEHLERAEDPAAAQAYLRAAMAAEAAFRQDEAVLLARRGSQIAGDADIQAMLVLKEAELLHDLGQGRDALECFARAFELSSDDLVRLKALLGQAAALRLLGESAAALAILDRAGLLAHAGDDAVRGRMHHLRGNLHFALGQADLCRQAHEAALDIARRHADPVLEAMAWSGLGDADYAVGRWVAAADSFRRCVDLAERVNRIRIAEPNRLMLGHCLIYSARFSESIALFRRALEKTLPLHDSYAEVFGFSSLGVGLLLSGNCTTTEPSLEQGTAIAKKVGAKRYEAQLLLLRAQCEYFEGNRALARELCAQANTLVNETGFGFVGPSSHAHLALTTDDEAERNRLLDEGEARLGESLAHNVAWFYRVAIEIRLAEKNWAAVDGLTERLLQFRPEGQPPRFHLMLAERAQAIAGWYRNPDALAAARMRAVRSDMESCGIALTFPDPDGTGGGGFGTRF
ncbi:MAG: adenylate/guanylate cyclase domain-containing protein [Dongiaceae bacterium]